MPAFALATYTQTLTPASVSPWPVPGYLVGTVRCQVYPSTSGSGGATANAASTGGGSGGAGYSEEPALAVPAGGTCAFVIPSGGAAGAGTVNALGGNPGDTTFTGSVVTVTGHPGTPGQCSNSNGPRGTGGPVSGNTISFAGGDGAPGVASGHGGGGGGSAGSGGAGGTAPSATGGAAGTPDGAAGANGAAAANTAGNPGSNPGAGAGGAKGGSIRLGAKGGDGKIVLTYTVLIPLGGRAVAGRPRLRKGGSGSSIGAPFTAVGPPIASPFFPPLQPIRGARALRTGKYASSKGAPFALPPPFRLAKFRPPGPVSGRPRLRKGSAKGAKGSPVVPFPASVVNQWAATVTQNPAWGDPVPGISSAVVELTPATSVGPGTGTPTMGNWLFMVAGWNEAAVLPPATVGTGDDSHMWWRVPSQPSAAGAGTRTVIWYQPNILTPSAVYTAPSAYMDGMAVTVLEVGGLGPWDQVAALVSGHVTGTLLNLAAGAPSAASFWLAAGTGNSAAAGTVLAPALWDAHTTVTATNGTDATSDTVLVTATTTSASGQSVNVTASSSEALSGMMIAVLEHAPSPVPAIRNPEWPSPLLLEAAFGSGYLTPPDEMVWTDLQTAGPQPRFLSWDGSAGVQYELDALESSEGQALLDNPDGALTPGNPSSPWFPDVVPGTPVRLRGVPPGSNRWYVIRQNVERWPQTWDELLRGMTNTALTDLWSVVNRELPTCFRAEVLNGLPYAWFPCDDPAVGNPTSLVNAAPGNALPIQIVTSPAGLGSTVSIPIGSTGSVPFKFSATQAFAQDGSWMYGDSDSAGWQQAGNGTGATGRYLYYADANLPSLAADGVTVEGWYKYDFAATAPPNTGSPFGPPGQPSGGVTLWAMYSGGATLAVLQLDSSGHLKLAVTGGSTTTIYSGSDLRNTTWFGVTVTMTATTWQCWLNGGIVATASGSLPGLSTWDAFSANATISGGSITGCGNATISHLAIYGVASPAPQVISRAVAAYTAYGQMPQPTGANITFIQTGQYAPDGNQHAGTFFQVPTIGFGSNSTLAALATGTAGSRTSGPVVPEAWNWCNSLSSGTNGFYAWLTATGPAVPEYSWWTDSQAGGEGLAATGPANYVMADSYGGGAAAPTAPSPAGDTVGQRLERILQAGGVTVPARCIDAASSPVVAALDTGGQAAGSALASVQASDSGMLFMATDGNLCYFSRPRLAASQVLWQLGADLDAGQIPYQFEPGPGGSPAGLDTDPQRIQNDIQVTQADVTGAGGGAASGSAETHGGLVFGPDASRYAGVLASQLQNGNCQARLTSYLQDQTLIQAQANWLFDQFGTARTRVTNLTVRAEAQSDSCPAAWLFFFAANPGDLMQAWFTPPGQPAFSGIWRISKITSRSLKFTLGGTEASISVIGDVYTPAYW